MPALRSCCPFQIAIRYSFTHTCTLYLDIYRQVRLQVHVYCGQSGQSFEYADLWVVTVIRQEVSEGPYQALGFFFAFLSHPLGHQNKDKETRKMICMYLLEIMNNYFRQGFEMDLDATKPVFGASDKARPKFSLLSCIVYRKIKFHLLQV